MPSILVDHQLMVLFLELFTTEELRRFIRDGPMGDEIVAKLPGHTASSEDVSSEAVAVLRRYGLLDEALFNRLLLVRPRRQAGIRAVQQLLVRTATAAKRDHRVPPPSMRESARLAADVLWVNALEDEMRAALAVGKDFGISWEPDKDSWGYPCNRGTFMDGSGRNSTILVSRSSEMGETDTATVATRLISDGAHAGMKPRCIVMSGICAGRRDAVRLGDIVVADRLFKFDNGKIEVLRKVTPDDLTVTEAAVFHDVKTFNLRRRLRREIEAFATLWDGAVSTPRPLSYEHQKHWLLDTLYSYSESRIPVVDLPERRAECPSWSKVIPQLQAAQLITVDSGALALTAEGKSHAAEYRLLHPDGFVRDYNRPSVHIGPIGTNARVQKDPWLFSRLQTLLRTILAIEMEGAAVGTVAEEAEIPAVVAKAVVDYADLEKNDNFRLYSCEASARFLFSLFHSDRVYRAL